MAVTVAVLGYASADRAVRVDHLPARDGTAVVRERLGTPWPRLGGCGPVIAAHLARAGLATGCVTWMADDAAGRRIGEQLLDAGVDLTGAAVVGTRTPASWLVYADDGAAFCIYDPGDAVEDGLTDVQRRVLAEADTVCLTVAPAAATLGALDAVASGARVVWSVKADPDAYPPALVRRLLERADVVTFTASEHEFLRRRLDAAPPFRADALVVETRGAAGVRWRLGAVSGEAPVQPLAVRDTTGAGDAFAAGLVAHLIDRPQDAAGAVAAGISHSRALLRARTEEVHA